MSLSEDHPVLVIPRPPLIDGQIKQGQTSPQVTQCQLHPRSVVINSDFHLLTTPTFLSCNLQVLEIGFLKSIFVPAQSFGN